jgi:DNA repair protein RecO (recombination protein O)
MITKTEAVVLKSMNYRDTSKIVTFYTRRFGKLKGIAKGARQLRSKFGSSLDPLSQVFLVLYKKEQRDLQLISQCDAVKNYKNLSKDLERLAVALAVAELINQIAHDEEGNDALYSLLAETLDCIEQAPRNHVNLFFAFELRCAGILGFSPNLESCSACGRGVDDIGPEKSVVFHLPRGGFFCSRCEAGDHAQSPDYRRERSRSTEWAGAGRSDEISVRVSIGTMKTLSYFRNVPLKTVTALELTPAGGNEIDGTLRLYLRQHFEGLKPVKSLDILRKLEGAGM